ncbi:MAG: hypothetical protein K6G36_00670 [Candidatus Saccharibacteria bacterium]|nr:hypothetical protein [Candidatus Saccharibacteria bacterium]
MKKILLALVLAVTVVSGVLVARPVFADNKCTTNILPDSLCDADAAKEGKGVKEMLNMIVGIMMAGVGVLGVLGVTIVGIQYLTASGSEEKTRKAKRRLFEIVIGVAAFLLIGALIRFLMPGVQ